MHDPESGEEPDSNIPPIDWDDDATETKPKPPRKGNGEGAHLVDIEPLPAGFGEDALAVEWVKQHGENWRYVLKWDRWFEWQGNIWRECETGKYFDLARIITRDALLWPGCPEAASTQRRINSASTAAAIVRLIRHDPKIATTTQIWDTHPHLLGTPAGVIDLRTGKLLEGEREHYVTMSAAVTPEAGEPTLWLQHLDLVLKGNKDVIAFLRRYFGYMLTGHVGEHCLVFLFGTGRNGKGTVVETVIKLLGDYGYSAPMNILMESRSERHPAELAKLRGKRGVSASEPPQGARWDDGRIRWLTGGDTITARGMREDFYSFQPTHKMIVMGNSKPMLRTVDPAIVSRFRIVDFSHFIEPEDRIPDFLDRLKAEWPKILNWMVQGSIEYFQIQSLGSPEDITRSTEDYLQSEDTFGQWLQDCCDRTGSASTKDLRASYTRWCEENGEHPTGTKTFSNALTNKGFKRVERLPGSRDRGFIGVKLLSLIR